MFYGLLLVSILLNYYLNYISVKLKPLEQSLAVINSSTPGGCGCNFRDIIFKLIIQNSSLGACCEIALMPWNLTYEKSILIQVMTLCHQATIHYLNQCWHRSMLQFGITSPLWVDSWTLISADTVACESFILFFVKILVRLVDWIIVAYTWQLQILSYIMTASQCRGLNNGGLHMAAPDTVLHYDC